MTDQTPWTLGKHVDAPAGDEVKPLGDGWAVWKPKPEPVVKVATGKCWAKTWSHTVDPMFADDPAEMKGFVHGTIVQETVNGKPIRIVWEADQ